MRPGLFAAAAVAALATTMLSSVAGRVTVIPAGFSPDGSSTASLAPVSSPPVSRPWSPAPCATGEFTDIRADAQRDTVLTANVSICGRYLPKYAFTLVAFPATHPVGFADTAYLSPYDPSGPTAVQGVIVEAPMSGEMGVCAMRSPADRIACVRLTFHGSEPTTMEPIPANDPLVSKPIVLIDERPRESSGGFCGSCLPIPW